ncbi:hypothetical protein ASPACDRAFT_1877595 [Aspergillus aculeatus ATCC 16872]|uniref:Uncharacterized protein n=1 Tax=Aspergillus aculeatus (strain ATCC 16872 / CBS 172.66 / WB 5094) TaxID=690307 RepID=A0A1L9WEI3_ASPA1|nr:uncharacterized protein ASPACDRAFT_1877595 [Aspergillus aculeatus ATCC 16872]OJJ94588.1 hypothetical protein ASPACDRAFT_1877595 [Aspergillus aculeatus ATCC 16872]
MALQPGCVGNYRGKKRPAETDPDNDQPLTKKFSHLQLTPLTFQDDTLGRPKLATSHQGDRMMLDDTNHTIYIHDLDMELQDLETLDNEVTILSGVVDTLSTVPRMLVADDQAHCTELVLYSEPVPLTAPKENDNVRKALVATRERARQIHHMKHGSSHPHQSIVPNLVAGRCDGITYPMCFNERMEIDTNN